MSYNVDRWITKELVDLKIPIASLFKNEEREDWHPQPVPVDDGTTAYEVMEDSFVAGHVIDGVLHVTNIHASGEGSGTALLFIIEPALADSTGRLVAVRVWEGGDSIDRLTVQDGKVTREPIEL